MARMGVVGKEHDERLTGNGIRAWLVSVWQQHDHLTDTDMTSRFVLSSNAFPEPSSLYLLIILSIYLICHGVPHI